MKKVILYLWQLPQNILGLLVILVTRAKLVPEYGVWNTKKYRFGVSLGSYIIFGSRWSEVSVKHERGHQEQSRKLGWLYLPVIGLPSLAGNIIDRTLHKRWSHTRRTNWYYNLLWEKQADKLGGVCRTYDQDGRYVRY